jgi:hypothetical protein
MIIIRLRYDTIPRCTDLVAFDWCWRLFSRVILNHSTRAKKEHLIHAMVPTRRTLLTVITLLTAFPGNVGALVLLPSRGITQRNALPILHLTRPKGCAAKPFEKKKVAIFGAGGYLGAVIFGFLQRASSL